MKQSAFWNTWEYVRIPIHGSYLLRYLLSRYLLSTYFRQVLNKECHSLEDGTNRCQCYSHSSVSVTCQCHVSVPNIESLVNLPQGIPFTVQFKKASTFRLRRLHVGYMSVTSVTCRLRGWGVGGAVGFLSEQVLEFVNYSSFPLLFGIRGIRIQHLHVGG